jgi:hypothetical protein
MVRYPLVRFYKKHPLTYDSSGGKMIKLCPLKKLVVGLSEPPTNYDPAKKPLE